MNAPSGTVPSRDTPAASESPSPTWVGLSPSARVKKTALPAWNRPLPTAYTMACTARARVRPAGGTTSRTAVRMVFLVLMTAQPTVPPAAGPSLLG
ncbi:hypothetical protein JNW88_19165 [Micromonospora sp. ATA32]|nr:hypothetical protein [Micromonospora sp. ATA32]